MTCDRGIRECATNLGKVDVSHVRGWGPKDRLNWWLETLRGADSEP